MSLNKIYLVHKNCYELNGFTDLHDLSTEFISSDQMIDSDIQTLSL